MDMEGFKYVKWGNSLGNSPLGEKEIYVVVYFVYLKRGA